MLKKLIVLAMPLALFGCPGSEDPTDDDTDLPTATDTAAPTGTTDDTDEPITPIPDPTYFNVTLTDGDGVNDATGGFDSDTIRLDITNTNGVEFLFGLAQTAVGTSGWYGEDCGAGEFCHPVPLATPDTSLTLTRVATIGAIVNGSTTLMNVDFPTNTTPGMTYFAGDVDITGPCWVWGEDISYYSDFGCETGTGAPM